MVTILLTGSYCTCCAHARTILYPEHRWCTVTSVCIFYACRYVPEHTVSCSTIEPLVYYDWTNTAPSGSGEAYVLSTIAQGLDSITLGRTSATFARLRHKVASVTYRTILKLPPEGSRKTMCIVDKESATAPQDCYAGLDLLQTCLYWNQHHTGWSEIVRVCSSNIDNNI